MAEQSASQALEQLRDQLHRATEQFHDRRIEMEHVMDGMEFRHNERVAAAAEQLRAAEKQVEEIEEKIRQLLAAAPPSSSPPAASSSGTIDASPSQRPTSS